MNEVLSYPEIKTRYDSEWVLLEDPQTTDSLDICGGRVLWHSKDRDEVYRKALELLPIHSAVVYTGEIPDNAAVIL